MRRVVLLSSVVVTGWAFGGFGETGDALAQCVATTDCASLGYTESSCPNGGIKCPFGTTWSCLENCNGEAGGSSSGSRAVCNVGDYFYSDKTCSSVEERDIFKTIIGVVFYSRPGGGGIALGLKPLSSTYLSCTMEWSTKYIVSPFPGKDKEDALNDFNSCENTKKLLEDGDETVYPAAWAAYNYTTEGTVKGDWCIPTLGTVDLLSKQADKVAEAFTAINLSLRTSWQDYYTSSLASQSIFVNIAIYDIYNRETSAFWYKNGSSNSLRSVYCDSGAYSDGRVSYSATVYPVIEF